MIVPDKSVPFPELLKEEEFGTVFIDGDHWNGVPLKDWENTKLRTNKYIMFDDYDRLHGDVVGAVKIAQNDPCWTAVLIHSVLALLEYTGNEK